MKKKTQFSHLDDGIESGVINVEDTDSPSSLSDQERGHSARQYSGMGQG